MLRSLMQVSGFTAISRVLGFVRDILIARYLGSGLLGDAFFSAFRFPNLFRRIFGEGAFNAAQPALHLDLFPAITAGLHSTKTA